MNTKTKKKQVAAAAAAAAAAVVEVAVVVVVVVVVVYFMSQLKDKTPFSSISFWVQFKVRNNNCFAMK